MARPNCGCGNTPNSSKSGSREMMIIQTSASEAATCGEPLAGANNTQGCALQEPTFDYIYSSFLIPVAGESIGITVCNASVYSVGQWLGFLGAVSVILKITAINGNIITLKNECDNGQAVESNPDAGSIVTENSRFSVVGEPDCRDEEERLQDVLDALADAEQVCVPSMIETLPDDTVSFVGRVENSPGNSAFGRCIKRISGISFRMGTMILSAMGAPVASTSVINYRRLGKHKTTNEVQQLPNYSDYPGLVTAKQYSLGVTPTNEYMIGPVYGHAMFEVPNLLNIGNVETSGVYVSVPTIYETTINLSAVTEITSLIRNQDHYWANVVITLLHVCPHNIGLYINDVFEAMISDFPEDGDASNIAFYAVIPVKMLNTTPTFKISLKRNTSSGNWPLALRVGLKGALI